MTTSTQPTKPVYIDIPLEELHDSPTNPRKVFDDASLQELAADIKHHRGVLQALLVRPRVPELFRNADDPNAQAGYEIVFGHRRRRGVEIAGLPTVRCEVRMMTDEEVARAQISENLNREGVHPIEEAEGFQALMRDHGVTAEDLVAQTGKSRSYIYGRLKLLQAAPEVREACLAGEFGSEVALLIARVGSATTQQDALAHLKTCREDPAAGGNLSYRRIRELLAERYTLDLDNAVFNIDSSTLIPKAGACTACPKRVGQDAAFDDLIEPPPPRYFGDVREGRTGACTDPDCFAAKKSKHFQDMAANLKQQGFNVLDPSKAKSAFNSYGNLNESKFTRCTEELQSEAAKVGLDPIVILDTKTGAKISAFRTSDLKLIRPTKPTIEQCRQQPRPQEERTALATAESALRKDRLLALRSSLQLSRRTLAEARYVAAAMIQCTDCYTEEAKDLFEGWGLDDIDRQDIKGSVLPALEKLTGDELARLMLHLACISLEINVTDYGFYYVDKEPEPNHILDGLAALHGIDTAKPSEPLPPAARAPEEVAAKAKGKAGAVAYRCPDSGQSWSGRGLKPKWVQAALAAGKTLADLAVGQKTDAPAALAPVGADGDGQAAAQEGINLVLGSAEQGLVEGAAAQGGDAGATAEA